MKIYKNFLEKEQFNNLKNTLESMSFPWYYTNGVTYTSNIEVPYAFKFSHYFYSQDRITSEHYNCLQPILAKLNYFSIIRIRANLSTRVPKIMLHEYHTDVTDQPKSLKMKTGIYYLNNTDGYTKFKNGKIVECEENTFVEFDSDLQHAGTFSSNSNRRIVINFNYIKLD